ncbi:protein FAM207A isoform X2 [Protopterus annectens]|uniref:protein FAM207A isoform X2 n=1 Tax=Protopterus annectens TaxID=7888 RepID=UPI001CFBB2A0|nr:protein FAM207A isoform X2 [Protopterus annectens]
MLNFQDWNMLSSSIFAGTTIDPKALVQKLEFEDNSSVVSIKKGSQEKPQLSKKEKAKQRQERWLQKIEAIKLATQKQKAEAKRKATPIVGDLHPLIDALPELSELAAVNKSTMHKKKPKPVKQKPTPKDYSRMKAPQKRKILEDEIDRFQQVISDPSFKTNPLTAVRSMLQKRLKQEEELS